MTKDCVLSSSSLTDNTVKNPQGEDLGTIKDIMICTDTNKVQYYVLSFGGFLGMGDKLFAVPPQAFTLDTEDKKLILNVDKEKLKAAEGFDENNWPDLADPTFAQQTYSHYGYEYGTVR
jgi:uncharacterized protein YrrD